MEDHVNVKILKMHVVSLMGTHTSNLGENEIKGNSLKTGHQVRIKNVFFKHSLSKKKNICPEREKEKMK